MQRRPRREPLPKFDIAMILRELGADDVPTGIGWVRMRCPFHGQDRTPSASVNHDPEIQYFKCHSCEVQGDGLGLLQTQLGLDFNDALARAKAIVGYEGPDVRTPSRQRRASTLLSRQPWDL